MKKASAATVLAAALQRDVPQNDLQTAAQGFVDSVFGETYPYGLVLTDSETVAISRAMIICEAASHMSANVSMADALTLAASYADMWFPDVLGA
ncbi:hypothetical protein KDA14_04740 [Candidatus Saccharibacteria bacterium]|nr:hypothetical protein [Candidatus Saccharibacteria bacterium]